MLQHAEAFASWHGRLVPLWAALILITGSLGAAAAGSARRPVPAAAGPKLVNEAAQAAKYTRCVKLAKRAPRSGERFAAAWRKAGGGHPAWQCEAVALFGLGRYREAAQSLDALAQAMVHAPAGLRAGVLDQAGEAWLLARDPVRAYADCGAAVALRPSDPELLIDFAETAAAVSDYRRAIGALNRVLAANPRRLDALIYRAAAYRALGRLAPALADIDQALRQSPKSLAALLERGNILVLKGDAAGASGDWSRVIALAPKSAAARAARANLAKLAAAERSSAAGRPPS